MSYLIKISGFYPKEFCYKCMFCRNNEYGESQCMLYNLEYIPSPDYIKPDWCPFNFAVEEE